MKKTMYLILLFLPLSLLAQENYSKKIQKYTRAYADAYDFHGAILVSKNNTVLYEEAFGYANKEWTVKNTSTTRFPIASLTKQFTAAAILQLAEQKKLSLDDRLSKYYPNYPKGDSITLHMLLNHTSGLQEYTQNPKLFKFSINATHTVSKDTVVSLFQKMPFNFAPGTFWGYTNTGYILLGYIIEQVSGQTYGDYIDKNLFQKSGMENSGLFKQEAVLSNKAYGYSQTPSGLIAQTVLSYNIGFGDGGIYSTVGDLQKWSQALHGATIIGKDYLTKMHQPNHENRGAGYGVFIDQFFDRKITYHTGNIPGYTSIMIHYVDEEINIIILANRETNLEFLPKGIAAILFDKEVLMPYTHKSISLQNENLKQYTANIETPVPFEVVEKEGKLFMSFGREIELLPESKTKLFVSEPDVDIQLEYVFNEKNEIVRVYLIEGGFKSEVTMR